MGYKRAKKFWFWFCLCKKKRDKIKVYNLKAFQFHRNKTDSQQPLTTGEIERGKIISMFWFCLHKKKRVEILGRNHKSAITLFVCN